MAMTVKALPKKLITCVSRIDSMQKEFSAFEADNLFLTGCYGENRLHGLVLDANTGHFGGSLRTYSHRHWWKFQYSYDLFSPRFSWAQKRNCPFR